MDILEPVWNSKDKYYSFLLVNAPSWIQVSDTTAPAPNPVTDISGMLTTFIERTAQYFMTPLSWSGLLASLEHIWVGWKEHIDSNPPVDRRPPAQITWRPIEMRVASDAQKLVWTIESTEVPPLRIPPGFGQPPPVRTVTVVSPEQEALISDLGMGMLEATDDIPYEDSPDVTSEPVERAEQRKKIRQARLRAAMAKLRAERLTEKYLDRYGDLENEDDSPLSSSDSDFGKI
jgi:hypothetical protein